MTLLTTAVCGAILGLTALAIKATAQKKKMAKAKVLIKKNR